MEKFTFNEAVNLSLRTWYPKDHELHMNPHHPLGKLLGEWGELLDDYMKSIYKPGYVFEPEDELGDIWYYIRILCYQGGFRGFRSVSDLDTNCPLESYIGVAMHFLSGDFADICIGRTSHPDKNSLDTSLSVLMHTLEYYNITLDQLTASNWEKLKPGSERGDQWAKARIQTDYAGGKIGLK